MLHVAGRSIRFASALIVLLMLSSLGCQSSEPTVFQPPPTEPQAFSLPAPGELARDLAYLDSDRFRLGIDYNPALPTNLVAPAYNYLFFRPFNDPETHPLFDGTAYAVYSFEVDGYDHDPTIAYNWYSRNGYDDSLWLGLANWDDNRWEWFRCDDSELLTLPTLDPYLDDDGTVLVAPLAYDPEQSLSGINFSILYYLRLGPRIGQWVVDVVDQEGVDVGAVSLALNRHGRPHIAYSDWTLGDCQVKHAALGMGWETYVVDNEDDTGYFPSITLEPSTELDVDEPRILYRSNTESSMKIAFGYFNDELGPGPAVDNWRWGSAFLNVIATNPVDAHLAAHDDSYYISYHNFDDKSLNYTYFNGLAWINTVVDDSADVGYTNWLAFNSAGRPCISYRNEDTESLMYAEHKGTGWETGVLDAGGGDNLGLVNCLTFGPDNLPQVCYSDETHEITVWAKHDGLDWQTEAVYDLDAHGIACAIVVDSEGTPHIAALDSDHNNLSHHWRKPDGTWLSQTIDFGGGTEPTGYCLAMQIDERDRLCIAYGGYYKDGVPYALKYAYQAD